MHHATSGLPRDLIPGEAPPGNHLHDGVEAGEVVGLAVVEGEHPLVDVAEQVERLDGDVGTVQAALEEGPEVLDAVRVDLAIDVDGGVVDGGVVVVPPMNVSSTSTVPSKRSKVPVCIARRMRWSMNQADFCVTPMARPNSWDEMPFFELAMSQMAHSHLSSLIGESSKIVPTLTLYCFLQSRHFQTRRVVR